MSDDFSSFSVGNTSDFFNMMIGARDINPGDPVSYQLCKDIYTLHPLGAKLVEAPIQIAMSQNREIHVQCSAEERVREQFCSVWKEMSIDRQIANLWRISRIYGTSTLVYGARGAKETNAPVDLRKVRADEIYFSVLDPMNTSGSYTTSQDPLDENFQKPTVIVAAGRQFHPSRAFSLMNEDPLFINWSTSSFGYSGRSVYQRALYPLKSFLYSMVADQIATVKAGVLVAKTKQTSGSNVDRGIMAMFARKREVVKEAKSGNVISIDVDESIESVDLANMSTALEVARMNILETIAAAASMPGRLLTSQAFAQGFSDGSEDSKAIALFIELERSRLNLLYDFMTNIVQYVAWTPEFFKSVQVTNPEYADMTFEQAFFQWRDSFDARWPNLIVEPDSKKIETQELKLRSVMSAITVMQNKMPQEEYAKLLEWATSNINESAHLFKYPLDLDFDAIAAYEPPVEDNKPLEGPAPSYV